ncbi:ABC transporter ATP-binding protein [Serpentinicella sp. ANB-PHB4]|uniref:ABC transporter ATP-binding protein n=1 Tax=Serpentinicella sp. ANB-PHB4 TaxID=3074076 RepID=UPI0028621980|nr:ABC transporter ATP-binding protein [Serpentinicella sp. ANB-PHB4]MDR5658781.1 ABC transporter ATP-binding protein [Serpentinicella sp. ANB-PHB4]
MIQLKDVKKSYKKTEAVKGINMEIKQGEILGLLGPNGAGKSTTISIIATLFPPTEGTVTYKEQDAIKNPKLVRKHLGMVPQEIALYPDLSAYDNLKFFGQLQGLKGKLLKERIDEVIEIIGIKEKIDNPIKTYSGGMKRRVNIGCALLNKPELLIMDEPTVGIDPQSRNHILETVKNLNKVGVTIIYTSHYMEEVEYLCDRIYIMDNGKIIAEGTKEALKASITNENTFVISLDKINPNFEKIASRITGVNSIKTEGSKMTVSVAKGTDILKNLIKAAEENGIAITSFSEKVPTLEDVFLSKTGKKLRD